MDNPLSIELPSEFTDERGVRRLRPVWIAQGQLPADVLPPTARLYALERRPASFDDQLYSYLTEDELAKYVGRAARPTTFEQLVATVTALPFPGTMRRLAWLQREVGTLGLDTESQIGAAIALYGPTIGELCARFLREREHGIAVSDVQIFALQRLVMLHARDAPVDEELDRDGLVQLLAALIAVPGTVLSPAEFGLGLPLDTDTPADPADEVWLRFFVGTGAMTTHGSFDHSIARARLLYQVIANSPAARKHKDYCPFDEWLRSEYTGFGFEDLQAIGFAMLAGFSATLNEGPPYLIDAHFFSTTDLHDRSHEAVAAVSADRDWYRTEFGKSPQTALRAAREIVPFLLRPALLQEDGRAAILAPRAITGWLSPSGTYWRLFHIAKRKGKLDEFFRFHGFLFERYARHLACVAHPDQRRRRLLGTAGVVHGDYPYRHEGESMTSDVAIDLGTDLVLVEMTAKRFTSGSTLDADIKKIRDDLNLMVVENMRQLGRVIGHLSDGTAVIPDLDMRVVKTVWPVIVAPESTLQSPTFWAYIEGAGTHFEQARQSVPQQVKPLVVLELEEYERLMGIARETGRLTDALERKTADRWRQRDFKSWHSGDPFPIGSGDNEFVQQEWLRARREIARRLDIRERRGDADGEGHAARVRAAACRERYAPLRRVSKVPSRCAMIPALVIRYDLASATHRDSLDLRSA